MKYFIRICTKLALKLDSNPAGVADLAGDVVLDDGGQDPIEDEHNVLAANATEQSSVGKER